MLRVSSCKAIEDIHFLTLEEIDHLLFECVENLPVDRVVDIAPVDEVVDSVGVDDVFVVRGTACEFAGRNCQGAGICQDSFTVSDSFLYENGRAEIAVHCRRSESESIETVSLFVVLLDRVCLLAVLNDSGIDHEETLLVCAYAH